MAYIEKTQSAFSGLIDKPVLTTELLSKPPFKFIFDIIHNLHKKTGIFKTFEQEDWNVAAYADKGAKTKFIDKVIKAVDDGTLTDIKSIKVLSGKHPELTNELLQRIAHVATKSEKKKAKKKLDSTKPKKEKDGSSKRSKDKEDHSSSKSKDSKEEKKKKKKKSEENTKKEKSGKTHKSLEDEPNMVEDNRDAELLSQIGGNGEKDVEAAMELAVPEPAEFVRPSVEQARPRTAARPAPPTLKKKQISTIRTSQEPAVAEVPIFNETTTAPQTDEDTFEIRENEMTENDDAIKTDESSGVLVQKIMENKAELDEKEFDENDTKSENHFSDEILVSNLQAEIQKITRQAYPVVQILEFVQEDIEAMMRELEKWRTETRENEQRLKDLIAKEFTDISRLSNNLSNLDRDIKAEVSEISFLKCRVLSNDLMIKERIFRD
ncbi:unnamed protein product [Auanema sp. JU1783]|nr:unnamed protein product [Auanema sp. JU1783]